MNDTTRPALSASTALSTSTVASRTSDLSTTAIFGSSLAVECHAARIGRDIERASADWGQSQDRHDASPRDPEGDAIRRHEEAVSDEASQRLYPLLDDLPNHRAATMEGALAQILAAGHFVSNLADCEPSEKLNDEVSENLRRILYSLKDFVLRELGHQPMPHTCEQIMGDNGDPFAPTKNEIDPQREDGLLEARQLSLIRVEMGNWLSELAASQRRMADRPDELLGSCVSFIARATENDLAADALLRGDSIDAIRSRLRALRGEAADGGQLFGILEVIEEQEAAAGHEVASSDRNAGGAAS
jgi:hypothetical protein